MSLIEHHVGFTLRLFSYLRLTTALAATLQTIFVSFVIVAVNLITGILTARYLGPAGRGEQAAMSVWPQLFAFCFSLGMAQTLIYKVRHEFNNASEFVFCGIVISVAAGSVAGIFGALLIPFWLSNYSPETISFAQLVMTATPLSAVYYVATAAVQAAGRFSWYNSLLLMPPILTLIGLLILAACDAFSPKLSTLAYVLPVVPALACSLLFLRRIYRPRFLFRSVIVGKLLSYGVQVWGIDLLVTLSRQADRAILVGLLSPAELGAYVVAQSMALTLNVVSNSVYAVLYPRAAGRSPNDIIATSGLAIRICGMIVSFAAVAAGLCAPILLTVLYGPTFAEAVVPFRILAADAVISAVNVLSIQVFMAAGRPGPVAILQAIGLAAYIPLAFTLVPLYGLDGAAVAWLVSSILRLVSIYLCFPLVLHVRPPWPFPRRSDFVALQGMISLRSRS